MSTHIRQHHHISCDAWRWWLYTAAMAITPAQCRAARAGIEWSREVLAKAAGLAERTIIDFERGARVPHGNNLAAVQAALEKAGVEFNDGCVCFKK